MLGWSGGSAGAAALLPSSFQPGDSAPDERPKRVKSAEEPAFAGFDTGGDEEAKPLFEAKLSKEEKKAKAAAKKAEREAKKNGGE
eukprot:6804129-Prymnesium_polylepis.1